MKKLLVLLFLLPFAGFAQTGSKKGTITVRKEKRAYTSGTLVNNIFLDEDPVYWNSYVLPEDTSIFTVVDKMPEYPGGTAAMNKFIAANLEFPTEGLQQTGTCYAAFVVNKDGTLSNIRVLRRSGCPACDQEVLRVIRLMPQNWTCGRQNDFPVRVQFNLPVRIHVR